MSINIRGIIIPDPRFFEDHVLTNLEFVPIFAKVHIREDHLKQLETFYEWYYANIPHYTRFYISEEYHKEFCDLFDADDEDFPIGWDDKSFNYIINQLLCAKYIESVDQYPPIIEWTRAVDERLKCVLYGGMRMIGEWAFKDRKAYDALKRVIRGQDYSEEDSAAIHAAIFTERQRINRNKKAKSYNP